MEGCRSIKLQSIIVWCYFLFQIVSYTADDGGYHASVVYQGEAQHDPPGHHHLLHHNNRGYKGDDVPKIKHSLHKSIVNGIDHTQIPEKPKPLFTKDAEEKQNDNLEHNNLTIEPFFPLPPLLQPIPQTTQHVERRYKYSPTPIPYTK